MAGKKSLSNNKDAALIKLQQAGLGNMAMEVLPVSLNSAEQIVFHLKKLQKKKTKEMICFIMYDIEDNKIRREVCKYLMKKGCQRVQKSVFLGKFDYQLFRDIHQTLKELQEVYENKDSILLVPISENELQKMKIIGKNITFEVTLGQKNTLFF